MKKLLLVSGLLGVLTACGPNSITYPSRPIVTATVRPAFAASAHWNSYVANNGSANWNGTGAACAPTSASRFSDCVRAGGIQAFDLPSVVGSCDGLSASDSLGVFNWACGTGPNGISFYSNGIKAGKGLRDLIDPVTLTWRPNYVTTAGGVSFQSQTSQWWADPILALPDNSGGAGPLVLQETNAVYVLAANQNTAGYNIDAEGISLVSMPSATLTFSVTPFTNCSKTTGKLAGADIKTAICSGGRNYLWYEMNMEAPLGINDGMFTFVASSFHQVRNSLVRNAGLNFYGVSGTRVNSMRFSNAGAYIMVGSVGNRFSQLQVTNSQVAFLGASTNNVLDQAIISNGYNGVDLQSSNNVVSRVTVSNVENAGVQLSGTISGSVVSFITVLNPNQAGLGVYGTTTNDLFHNVAILNSGQQGINATGTGNYSHLALLSSGAGGIAVPTGNNRFSGLLVTGGNPTDCAVAAGSPYSGISPACASNDPSTGVATNLVTYVPNAVLTDLIKGKLTVDDANPDDTLGTYPSFPSPTSALDWITFTNTTTLPFDLFKTWGRNGGTFPDAGQRSSWGNGGGAGQIWDVALTSTSRLRNATETGLPGNAALVNGAACPAWLHGNITLSSYGGGPVFLANAFELMNSGGNDNGLCETGETCVAAPNFGAYQGEGDYLSQSCAFSSGTVSSVKMYFYPTNGR